MSAKHSSMNQRQLLEEYEESKVKLLMAQFAEAEGQALWNENEELRNNLLYQPSDQQISDFAKRVRKHWWIYRWQKVRDWCGAGTLKRVMTIAITVIVLMATTVLSVDALRSRLLNLLIQIEESFTNIKLEPQNEQDAVEDLHSMMKPYRPTQLPAGYHLATVSNLSNQRIMQYKNEQDEWLVFYQMNEASSLNVDTEGAEEVTALTIQGQDGLYVVKQTKQTVVWKEEDSLFLIISSAAALDKEALLHMAQSVQTLK